MRAFFLQGHGKLSVIMRCPCYVGVCKAGFHCNNNDNDDCAVALQTSVYLMITKNDNDNKNNHNCNKILKPDWLSIGQCNRTVCVMPM